METDTPRPANETVRQAEEAQKALQQRPEVSIRSRLTVGLLFWFVLTVGLSVASIVTLSSIGGKLSFTEALERYTFEIQQARRFEKNYFLYHTNLADALDHVHAAQAILDQEETNIEAIIGEFGHQQVLTNLQLYEELLVRLQNLDRVQQGDQSEEYGEIETGLREHGALMVSEAENLVSRERRAVISMLSISRKIPVAFIVVLLGVIAYLALLIRRQVLAPLARMMKTTERIANGDFTPITPVRKYHDEFSHLAIALNHMMMQLAHRQELLVQAHKLRAVGTLTAGVAHELNNPINNIMLTAACLEEDYEDLPDTIRLGMVRDLVGESERAQRIVRNLLDFARESSIQSAAIDPQRLVEETLRLATNQIKLAKVKVRGEIDENLPAINGDFQQLTQVLLNIVLNALDAMPGGGTLTIGIRNPMGKDQVALEFKDTGTGMPEHVVCNVFDPFFTTKSGAKGTGLGLSVSLGIVRQHGGDILVESTPGAGTTFFVRLPVAMVPAPILEDVSEDGGLSDDDEEEEMIE
jgi:two-component system NtrC family sensor kinase